MLSSMGSPEVLLQRETPHRAGLHLPGGTPTTVGTVHATLDQARTAVTCSWIPMAIFPARCFTLTVNGPLRSTVRTAS